MQLESDTGRAGPGIRSSSIALDLSSPTSFTSSHNWSNTVSITHAQGIELVISHPSAACVDCARPQRHSLSDRLVKEHCTEVNERWPTDSFVFLVEAHTAGAQRQTSSSASSGVECDERMRRWSTWWRLGMELKTSVTLDGDNSADNYHKFEVRNARCEQGYDEPV